MSGTTVLVVDDEPLIRWSVGERLRAEGYDVLEAADARAAVALFERGVDIVLLDSKLPDMGCMTVLRNLIDGDPKVRLILMTSDAGLESAADVLKNSGLPRANKPFLLDDIVSLVKRPAAEVFPHTSGKLRTA